MEEISKELKQEEMEEVTGGEGEEGSAPVSLPRGCPHKHWKRIVKYNLQKKDWDGWTHVSIAHYIFICKDCGQRWESKDPNFVIPR